MAASHDVIIVGGGAIGAACARELAGAGRRVLLLDRPDDAGAAWRAAAGMLAPQVETGQDDPLFELGVAGRDRYRALAEPLKESTGIDIGLWLEGIAQVAVADSDEDALRSKAAWQRQQGHLCDWLDAEEVKARWPWLGPTQGALWAPREGAVNPTRLVEALRADAQLRGAELVRDTVTGIERAGDRVTGVRGRERYRAEHVVIAAGAWSGRLTGLPRPLSIEPIRGQMAALPWPEEADPTIVFGGGGYLVFREGEAIAGSTMEYAGFEAEVTSAGLARIFTGAAQLCPSLARQDVLRTWAGLRPGTPDGRPILGPAPDVTGLWYATGHNRNGILLAGITGVIVGQLLAGEPTAVEDLSAVDPSRFWAW